MGFGDGGANGRLEQKVRDMEANIKRLKRKASIDGIKRNLDAVKDAVAMLSNTRRGTSCRCERRSSRYHGARVRLSRSSSFSSSSFSSSSPHSMNLRGGADSAEYKNLVGYRGQRDRYRPRRSRSRAEDYRYPRASSPQVYETEERYNMAGRQGRADEYEHRGRPRRRSYIRRRSSSSTDHEHGTHDDERELKWQARLESRIQEAEHRLGEQLSKAKREEEEELAKKAAEEREARVHHHQRTRSRSQSKHRYVFIPGKGIQQEKTTILFELTDHEDSGPRQHFSAAHGQGHHQHHRNHQHHQHHDCRDHDIHHRHSRIRKGAS